MHIVGLFLYIVLLVRKRLNTVADLLIIDVDLIITVSDLTNVGVVLTFTRTFLPFSTALSAFFLALKSETRFCLASLVNCPTIAILPIVLKSSDCGLILYINKV